MRPTRLFALLAVCLGIGFACRADALEPPRIIPMSGQASKPIEQVFSTLKGYFSDPSLSRFNLVSADEATHTIVAKQNGIDVARWNRWAACKTNPMHMIYQFSDGVVTVTAKLSPAVHDTTFVTVDADFHGTYKLGTSTITIPCVSTGTLEQNLLAVAGVPATNSSP